MFTKAAPSECFGLSHNQDCPCAYRDTDGGLIGLDGAERKILSRDIELRKGIEEGGLANVRDANDTHLDIVAGAENAYSEMLDDASVMFSEIGIPAEVGKPRSFVVFLLRGHGSDLSDKSRTK
jgi:hypothetical protein